MGADFLEIVIEAESLRKAALRFSARILLLSFVIFAIGATLIYLALHYPFVRPMRQVPYAILTKNCRESAHYPLKGMTAMRLWTAVAAIVLSLSASAVIADGCPKIGDDVAADRPSLLVRST
jgi:hypothetical protein